MKTVNFTLQMLFLVLLLAQIPQTFQEQVEPTAAEAPDTELPESGEKSVDLGKLVSAKIASDGKTKFLPDGRILDREITLHKSNSNAETAEISDLDAAAKPVLDEPSKTMEDASGMSWTEASGMMPTNERPPENLRPRGSYTGGGSSDDDDDDDGEEEDDEGTDVSVIVVVVGVGVVVALAGVVLAIWWCRKRRIAQQSREVHREVHREVPPGGPPKVPARHANEEALLDDQTQE